jgi:hypothetical protein
MRRAVGAWVIGWLAAAGAGAQPLVPPEALARGRELMTLGDPLGAADAFHEALRGRGAGLYTVRVGVYCDITNLERQARAIGNPKELFVLRRSVAGRPCLGLFWGLFPSRTAARAALATMPAALRAAGQASVAVTDVLPPGEPAPPQVTTLPPPSPPGEALVAPPAAAPAPPEAPLATEPLVSEPAEAPPAVAPPAARREVAPLESPPAEPPAEPVGVPTLEATVAYSGLWDDTFSRGGGDGFYELGWVLSLCGNLSRSIGVVGEASGHYSSEDTLDDAGAPLAVDRDLLGVHAGLRYTHRGGGRVAAYAQALGGWTRSGLEISGRRELEDAFSVQPGLGLHVRLSTSVGLAVGVDYRLVLGDEQDRGEVRFHAGVVIAAGER